jgi:hypothetical protein
MVLYGVVKRSIWWSSRFYYFKYETSYKNQLVRVILSFGKIIKAYEATNKDLRFDDAYIENMLNIQYGEARCRAVLHLLFPELKATEIFHIDHLHPQTMFTKKYLQS